MTGRDLIIDAPEQRSRFLRWRDRGLTLLLWSAWSRPVEAIARFAAGPTGADGGQVWDTFLRDLGDASTTAGVLIAVLYAWVGYERVRRTSTGTGPDQGPPTRVACAAPPAGRILAAVSEKLRRARLIQAAVVALAVLSAATPADEMLHDFVFRHFVSHETRLLANGFTLLGTTEVATVGLLGLAVAGYRAVDAPMWQAAVGGIAGVLLAGLTTQIVKNVACRARPRLVDGWGVGASTPPDAPARRGFFHWPCFGEPGYQGFPSGHAATAFAAAAALAGWIPPRRRGWLLAVASGIGASRILLNAHFLSDVLGGGLFGWWAGEAGVSLVSRYVAPRWRARAAGTAPRSRVSA